MAEIIDSRTLIEEARELEDALSNEAEPGALDEYGSREVVIERLAAIEALADEVDGDWQYGVMLIPDGEFEDYARDLAEDIGAVNPRAGWPLTYIDWGAAADALRQDYLAVEFDGMTYLVRA